MLVPTDKELALQSPQSRAEAQKPAIIMVQVTQHGGYLRACEIFAAPTSPNRTQVILRLIRPEKTRHSGVGVDALSILVASLARLTTMKRLGISLA